MHRRNLQYIHAHCSALRCAYSCTDIVSECQPNTSTHIHTVCIANPVPITCAYCYTHTGTNSSTYASTQSEADFFS